MPLAKGAGHAVSLVFAGVEGLGGGVRSMGWAVAVRTLNPAARWV
jgi:hypothetical protein